MIRSDAAVAVKSRSIWGSLGTAVGHIELAQG
jgi:hypothetical protein